MSEKDKTSQDLAKDDAAQASGSKPGGKKPAAQSREDRLADALRANLRRRKSAARKNKEE